MRTWYGQRLALPERLPDFPKMRVQSPHVLRLYYNACAFGYTTAFWDWPQWERELDWMALHGINLPLASVGTEAIWERVWRDLGLTQAEVDDYTIGPAFLPFQRMACINQHCGPLPASWHRQTVALQKQIVARMRELGMEPLAPGFAGNVPAALKRVRPEASVKLLPSWAGMPEEQRVSILDPLSPLYEEIGRRFIQEWRKEFGPAKYFLVDSFIESEPPVSTNRQERLEQLAGYGEAVYRSIIAGEPDAVWLMQGWLFHYKRAFWDRDSVRALLSQVPNDRMIIVDLFNERFAGWEKLDGFFGKHWMYSVIHNFGGRSPLTGNLQFYATDPVRSLPTPAAKRQVGFGLSPEGVENNEVVYELLTDMMWRDQPVELETWLRDYARARYGACPEPMFQAWQLLARSCYGRYERSARHGFQRSPSPRPASDVQADPIFRDAVKQFLACAAELGDEPFYRADAIELVAQWAGVRATELLVEAAAAHEQGQADVRDARAREAFDLMRKMDTLLAAHPVFRLERWLNFARAWGTTPEEADHYERNARMQVTFWGNTRLSDYSARVWSGLIRDYYLPRWERYFASLRAGETPDVRDWEQQWIAQRGVSPVQPPRDVLAAARALVAELDRSEESKPGASPAGAIPKE
jgi:alpha-N-acetylglucosaminidase